MLTGIAHQDLEFVVHSRKYLGFQKLSLRIWSLQNESFDTRFHTEGLPKLLFFSVKTCGASISNNCTYIQNPNYPSSESTGTSCSFSISPLSADICQLRLDFDNFDITETSPATGTCVDTFDVTSGSSRDYYALCGTLTGQHIYVETGRKTSTQTLAFTIATTSTVATWRIKVNQIECYSTSK